MAEALALTRLRSLGSLRDGAPPASSAAPSTVAARAAYARAVERLTADLRSLPPDAPVRLAKRTSNLFRMRDASAAPGLDVSAFSGVIEVDAARRTADVLGMTTYEDLVDATLRHGLMPLVVPELKTITLGGAVTGSRHRVDVVPQRLPPRVGVSTSTSSPETAGSHGHARRAPRRSLHRLPELLRHARATRCDCASSCSRSSRSSQLQHFLHRTTADAARTFAEITAARRAPGAAVDFVDGVVFAPDQIVVTVGRFVDEAPYLSDYTRRTSTTGRCSTAAATTSPSATTSGAGTPTGSGAPVPSASRTRWCVPCCRVACSAATCTGRSSASNGVTAGSAHWTPDADSPPANR